MMQIEQINIEDIKPYKKNAKLHPQRQIDQIIESIKQFGNNDPIAIDEKNVIIEGHGRYEALKQMGATEVPVIKLKHLKSQQKKAYILAHNKLTMNSDFDIDILNEELEAITDIDMSIFDFEPVLDDDFDDLVEDNNERERTGDAYNLTDFDSSRTEGLWQMPKLKPCKHVPKDLISFNYMLTSSEYDKGIHFYIDDYQFERLWNRPYEYIYKLKEFDCVLTPDFSLYLDMPKPMKIWNVYRSKLLGQMMQDAGIQVIPTLQWAEEDTFEWCFDGIPKNATVSVSTIGVKNDPEALSIWYNGMDATIERLQPKTIVLYGGRLEEYDFGDIKVVEILNHTTERMKASKKHD